MSAALAWRAVGGCPLLALLVLGGVGSVPLQPEDAEAEVSEHILPVSHVLPVSAAQATVPPADLETSSLDEDFNPPFESCVGTGYSWYQDRRANAACFDSQCCPNCCPPSINRVWGTDTCPWNTIFPNGARVGFLHVGKTAGSTIGRSLKRMSDASASFLPGGVFLNISEMHTTASKEGRGLDHPWDLLVISTRDPVGRTVSAFNYELENAPFRAMPLIQRMQQCFPQPGDGTALGALDAFARAVTSPEEPCGLLARRCILEGPEAVGPEGHKTDLSYCGHLNMNHRHYVANSHGTLQTTPMNAIRSGQTRAYLVRQETIDMDLRGVFEWLCMPPAAWDSEAFLTTSDILPSASVEIGPARHQDTVLSAEGNRSLSMALIGEYQVLEALEELADNGFNRASMNFARADHRLWDSAPPP